MSLEPGKRGSGGYRQDSNGTELLVAATPIPVNRLPKLLVRFISLDTAYIETCMGGPPRLRRG